MVLNPSPDSVTSQPSVMIIYLIFEEKFSEAATDKTNHKAKLQISKIFLLRNNSEGPGESFPEFEFHKRIATSRIREGMDRMGIGEAWKILSKSQKKKPRLEANFSNLCENFENLWKVSRKINKTIIKSKIAFLVVRGAKPPDPVEFFRNVGEKQWKIRKCHYSRGDLLIQSQFK